MTELTVLRTIALKGRVSVDDVVATTGLPTSDVAPQVEASTAAGHVVLTPQGALRTTPDGRARVQDLLADERAEVDTSAMTRLYEAFSEVNAAAKATFTAWQLRDGEPNDHADAGYDESVLARLTEHHAEVLPVIDEVATLVARAGRYRERLEEAQRRYASGDHAYVTRPVIDSYHTVWFEMHEDLISWAGLTRAEEAAAGRAS